MRRPGRLFAVILMALLFTFPGSALGYTNGHLMDDAVMSRVASMSEPQIESLLSHTACLASYTDTGFHWDGEHWSYEGSWTAAKIIFEAAHQWGLNPQVIIAKLQQEEGLLSTKTCDSWRYSSAMGYDCPDGETCSSKYAGFTKQVLWGSWQLRFDQERSQGRTAWDEDGTIVYAGFMLKGDFARCEGCATSEFDGVASIDGSEVFLETGATAALYSYTPHLAGGRLFVEVFEEYFGSTVKEEIKEEPEPKEPPKEEVHLQPAPEVVHQQVITPPQQGLSGTSPISQPAHCVVPRLKGKTLAVAMRLISRAHCKVGAVKRSKHHGKRKPVVVGQSQAAGKKLLAGTKIALRLG